MHLCICFGVVHFKEYGKKPFPKKFTFLVDMSANMKVFLWVGGMNSLECIKNNYHKTYILAHMTVDMSAKNVIFFSTVPIN